MAGRYMRSNLWLIAIALVGGIVAASACTTTASPYGVSPEAMSLHQRLLTLDTHLDTPARLVGARPFDIMTRHDVDRDGSQVDVPRMNEGGLDGGFWVVYTPQGPLTAEAYARVRDTAILRSLAIQKMVAEHPDTFVLATRSSDAERIDALGKKIVYQSIENSYPLGEDLSLVETFYRLGVRMIGPVHNGNNQFADSAIDTSGPRWGGLSPLGKQLVVEANRLGMVLDGSHSSDSAIDQMIDLSATPIILSHSGSKDLFNHPRNTPDALLKKLADHGGVVQMNALGGYLRRLEQSPERLAAIAALREKWGPPDALVADQYALYLDKSQAINESFPEQRADLVDYMEQFLHVLKLVGPKHVGVGADWDGGGGVSGMRDILAIARITDRLLAEGYSEADLQNIWGGNVLRLLEHAEDFAQSGQ